MIMGCDTTRSAGGRGGHRRRWPLAEKLRDDLQALLAPVFCQARSRLAAFAYLGALLAEPGDRRSCWQLAEAAGDATPRRLQALLAEQAWDWKAALRAVQRFILDHLGDPGAVLVLDETAELKKGEMTVGVGRQHAGITGQVENCQTVVNCAYVTARGHAPGIPGIAENDLDLCGYRLVVSPHDDCALRAPMARLGVEQGDAAHSRRPPRRRTRSGRRGGDRAGA
jgi:hypothetical protein